MSFLHIDVTLVKLTPVQCFDNSLYIEKGDPDYRPIERWTPIFQVFIYHFGNKIALMSNVFHLREV